MASPSNNLLLRLHKWAWRQDENFLTEAFAHLLRYLLENEPEAAVAIVKTLTGGFLNLSYEEAKLLEVRTQVFLGEGTPDLELRTLKQLAYIEVKLESELGPLQLSRYRSLLQASGIEQTALFLLTRYPANVAEGEEKPDGLLRWYQVAEWISQERTRYSFKPVSSFLVDQFLEFLGARNMTMGQVTWELSGGIRALRTLTDMLFEAASASGLRARMVGDKNFMGVYLDGKNYWIGVYFERPEMLIFETDAMPVNKETAERLGIGSVEEWGEGHSWERELNLESEEVHFFARSKASQMQVLESYLEECLKLVKQIEIRDAKKSSDEESEEQPKKE